jgi:hypothetical protein
MSNSDERFAYVDHMLAEHRRVERLVRRTLAVIPAWEEADQPQWLPLMVQGLTSIRVELAHHFQSEEQGGCLEEAVARCPPLATDVQCVQRQHNELLEHLDELIARCQTTAASAAKARAVDQELRHVVRELRLHEAHENRIMQRGFGVCIEGQTLDQQPVTTALVE